MLKLVLGGSGSGKTTLLYARIKARAEAGQRSILLVPEQFTSSTEGRIYRELGDALSGMVDSYSFTSLAEHILSAEGRIAQPAPLQQRLKRQPALNPGLGAGRIDHAARLGGESIRSHMEVDAQQFVHRDQTPDHPRRRQGHGPYARGLVQPRGHIRFKEDRIGKVRRLREQALDRRVEFISRHGMRSRLQPAPAGAGPEVYPDHA